MSVSAYEKFIVDSAEQYLQTVVLIDDKIYEGKSGQVTSRLEKPSSVKRISALKSASSTSDTTGTKPKNSESSEEREEVSFHDIQNSFAKQRIICSLYQPNKTASFSEKSDAYKLCATADVVIVDWDLHGDSGVKATTLVGCLIEQSQTEIPYQLRLVLIYTLDPNLGSVANTVFVDLENRLGTGVIDVGEHPQGLVLKTENARVVILGKREDTSLTQFSDCCVTEGQLATRTIKEFSYLASGILQSMVLRGIANIRKNNRRILMRFHEDLDIAFLAHRALLLPDEAFGQLTPLLTDEIRAVLEDTLGYRPIGPVSTCKKILNSWFDTHWKKKNNPELSVGEGSDCKDFAKDVLCNGPSFTEKNYNGKGTQVQGMVEKGEDGILKWNGKKIAKLANDLLGDCGVEYCHEKLGSLMSQRIMYGNSRKELHLGVIVRELFASKRYLFCLQPVCDSVRMNSDERGFIFCVLKVATSDDSFTHCIIDENGNVIRLKYKPNVPDLFSVNFRSDSDAICAKKDYKKRFVFRDEKKNGYEWIAELKSEHAQRAAEQFGRELSRVGLTESEWLRIKAK